mgnify:CR=1 FL=1
MARKAEFSINGLSVLAELYGVSTSTFYYEVESDEISKKENFLYSSLCIGTPNSDIDLIGGLIFKSKVLTGELESGKHKGMYMNLCTSEINNMKYRLIMSHQFKNN